MTAIIDGADQSQIAIDHLTGTARLVAELILKHGTYEFEGFKWLAGNFEGIGDHLGVSEKTIQRVVKKPPFHHITRRTVENGKHILLKLGTEPCETDHVFRLRATWVRGIVFYNAVAAEAWTMKVMQLKHQNAPNALWGRLLHRIKSAEERALDLEKLKAGKRISYEVEPHEMGCLRGIVTTLTDDAFSVIACLTTFEGWTRFMAYAKTAHRFKDRHFHWPNLPVIVANPDLALQTYLDIAQATTKVDILESARLLAKIDSLVPSTD